MPLLWSANWFGLVWFALVWFGLVWFGSVLLGSVRFGLILFHTRTTGMTGNLNPPAAFLGGAALRANSVPVRFPTISKSEGASPWRTHPLD